MALTFPPLCTAMCFATIREKHNSASDSIFLEYLNKIHVFSSRVGFVIQLLPWEPPIKASFVLLCFCVKISTFSSYQSIKQKCNIFFPKCILFYLLTWSTKVDIPIWNMQQDSRCFIFRFFEGVKSLFYVTQINSRIFLKFDSLLFLSLNIITKIF